MIVAFEEAADQIVTELGVLEMFTALNAKVYRSLLKEKGRGA